MDGQPMTQDACHGGDLGEGHSVPTAHAGFISDAERRYPVAVLEALLRDRTTGRNIIWADDEYDALGDGYHAEDEVTVEKITGFNSGVIKPRIAKEQERQSMRTKSRAEVFTPSWLCNFMNNRIDEEWFSRGGVFNVEDGSGWRSVEDPVPFGGDGKTWHDYVRCRRIEITCGEAPFVCSRYDSVTGEAIPVASRIGFLDRKLRAVTENAASRDEWIEWAYEALKSTYAYEFQGDNLVVARINALETFAEHAEARWGERPSDAEIEVAAEIVSWNLWQMDGLTCAVPADGAALAVHSDLFSGGKEKPEPEQMSLFDFEPEEEEPAGLFVTTPLCVMYDWRNDAPLEFASLRSEAKSDMDKKFYAVIGNPPYQTEPELGSTRALPVYDKFMDEAYKVSDRVELITPARFLFGSGQTKAAWNEQMLSDRHLKVLYYEADSSKLFSGVDIKGGVAVTYRDATTDHEPIGMFIPIRELRGIVEKAAANSTEDSLTSIAGTQCNYNFDELYKDHPEYRQYISGDGRHSQLKSNALERVPIFTKEKQNDDDLCILGRVNGERAYRYCPRRYIDLSNQSLMAYKVILPASNGSGAFGEVLSTPLIGGPLIGFTQTFMCIGRFASKEEAEAALKYVKTKFCRVLLGVLKNTQHNPPITWRKIPLQDFASGSDIDWSQSVPEIDAQLYRKYGLSDEEIEFVETNVKEMS